MNDLRYALRQLRRTPGFSPASIVTPAPCIGATTATFSVINGLLLRPLPVEEPGRLVNLREQTESRRFKGSHSLPEYLEYRRLAAGAPGYRQHASPVPTGTLGWVFLRGGDSGSREIVKNDRKPS